MVICNFCSKIIHHTCISEADYKFIDTTNTWSCSDCYAHNGPKRYNPFEDYVVNSSSHFYDQEPVDHMECLQDISNVLKQCCAYDVDDFNVKIQNTFQSNDNS